MHYICAFHFGLGIIIYSNDNDNNSNETTPVKWSKRDLTPQLHDFTSQRPA